MNSGHKILLCSVALLAWLWCTSYELSAQSPTRAAPVSLDELKVTSAAKSSYLKPTPPAVDVEAPTPSLDVFREKLAPILTAACVDCHGPDTQEGNVRIDTLDPNLFHGQDVDWWLEVLAVLTNGEMPPADANELAATDRASLVEWLSNELDLASTVRRAEQGHSSFRRMTRYEFNYALQDLLGLPFDFAKDLPPESRSEDGFENSSDLLQMSSMQFDAYREAARNALLRATVRGDQPVPLYWSVSMEEAAAKVWAQQDEELRKVKEQHQDDPEALQQALERHAAQRQQPPRNTYFLDLDTGRVGRVQWSYGGAEYAWAPSSSPPPSAGRSRHVAVLPPKQRLIVELGDRIPDHGPMRVRVLASRNDSEERTPSLQLEFGWQASNDSAASVRVSEQDIPIVADPDGPQWYGWDIPLGEVYPRNSVRNISKMGDLPSPSEFLKFVNSSDVEGTVRIEHVEVTAPAYTTWPPKSHQQILGNGEDASSVEDSVYARDVLERFMLRAWRRPITTEELERKVRLFSRILPTCDDRQQALVEVLSTVLASPHCLYVPAPDHAQSQVGNRGLYDLASRLSLFLWCSIPDQTLLDAAENGTLADPELLRQQVARMLEDPRSQRFSEHFVRQWLGMQLLDYLDVDRRAYPHFDRALKEAMQQEPVLFFQTIMASNRSVLDFLHSNDAMMNERLARHYGVNGVYGNAFRLVPLDAGTHRGGILTQAGLLAMNSDGKDSHPLKRGIWLLESLLNDPPPPPPPAVPEIDLADPEIAKLSLKDRMEDHRNDPACLSCHAKIDPWGIAFENFDAVGSFRTQTDGKPVDSVSQLFNGEALDGMEGLKRYLLESRQDQFVRALVTKMATYALGRPLSFGDRSSIEQITAEVRKQGDGLGTMVQLLVKSDLFQGRGGDSLARTQVTEKAPGVSAP